MSSNDRPTITDLNHPADDPAPPGAPAHGAAFDSWAVGKIKQAGGLTALEGAHLIGESEEALASEAAATLRVRDGGEEETT